MRIKLAAIGVFFIFLSACSTAPKSGDVASSPKSTDTPQATPQIQPEVKAPGLLSSRDVSRGRKLPERYQRFQAALRALDERVLLEEAGKFLSVDENDLIVLNGLGIFHFQKSQPEAARIFWERGLGAHAEHPTFLNNLAVVEIQADQEAVALEYLRTAYKQDPRHFEVLMNLGGLYLEGGSQKLPEFSGRGA